MLALDKVAGLAGWVNLRQRRPGKLHGQDSHCHFHPRRQKKSSTRRCRRHPPHRRPSGTSAAPFSPMKMDRLSLLSHHLTADTGRSDDENQQQQVAGATVPTPAAGQTQRPKIAVLVTFWGATSSHADWIVTKLIDGYWWDGAYTPSRVDIASIYMHQHDTSVLGQRVAESKGIPVFETVDGAVTLGGDDLAVDGVVIVGEHGWVVPATPANNTPATLVSFAQLPAEPRSKHDVVDLKMILH